MSITNNTLAPLAGQLAVLSATRRADLGWPWRREPGSGAALELVSSARRCEHRCYHPPAPLPAGLAELEELRLTLRMELVERHSPLFAAPGFRPDAALPAELFHLAAIVVRAASDWYVDLELTRVAADAQQRLLEQAAGAAAAALATHPDDLAILTAVTMLHAARQRQCGVPVPELPPLPAQLVRAYLAAREPASVETLNQLANLLLLPVVPIWLKAAEQNGEPAWQLNPFLPPHQ